MASPAKQVITKVCNAGNACLAYVEYDEIGRPYNGGKKSDTRHQARLVVESNGIVVVFVHGWHHGAAPGDTNIEAFREVLQRAVRIDTALRWANIFHSSPTWRSCRMRVGAARMTKRSLPAPAPQVSRSPKPFASSTGRP
jgi:hypothetical protein